MRTPSDISRSFSKATISQDHEADSIGCDYVIAHNNLIVALRLLKSYNPKITENPAQVWVGETPDSVPLWGDRLAQFRSKLHLYVRSQNSDSYEYQGQFRVLDRQATDSELVYARNAVPHKRGVSRIVFLQSAE